MSASEQVLIGVYSRQDVRARLGDLVFQVHAAATNADEGAIHDLRVAIRRLEQSLRVFASLLPNAETRRIRKQLGKLLDLAGAVRDIDIALEMIEEAGVAKNDPIHKRLLQGRTLGEQQLIERIHKWSRSEFSAKWRSDLQLIPQ